MEHKGKANVATALNIVGVLLMLAGVFVGFQNKDVITGVGGFVSGMAFLGFAAIIDLLVVLIDEIKKQNKPNY